MVWRLAWARYHFDPPPPDGWFGEAVTRKLEIPGLNPGQTITVYIYITLICRDIPTIRDTIIYLNQTLLTKIC